MKFTSRTKSVKSGLKPSNKRGKSCKNITTAYAECRANVYFDFETTLSDETHQPQYRGLQQAFLVSLTIDISIPLKSVAEAVFGKVQDGIEDVKLYIPFELLWGLDCDVELIDRLQQLQDIVRKGCQPFNDLLEARGVKQPPISDQLRAISFNGSKFDNQFVVKGLVKIYA